MITNKYDNTRNIIDNITALLAFIYTFVSFGLSGVADISRLSFISAAFMVMLLIARKQKLVVPPWILLISAFYLYLIIPVLGLVTPPWETIFGMSTAFIGTVCIALILVNRIGTSNLLAYAMFIAVIVNIIAITLGIDTTPKEYQGAGLVRLTGLLGNANTLSINFSLTAFSLWLLAPIYMSVKILSLLAAFYGVLVSGSRKGVIFLVFLLIFTGKHFIEKISKLRQFTLFVLLLAISVFFYEYFDNIFDILNENVLAIDRFTMIFRGSDSSFSEREWLIKTGLQIWEKSPLIGEGIGQFASLSGFGGYSHNNYVELLVSGGIIALFLYYILYALIIYYAFKFHRNKRFYAAIIVTTMLVIDTAAVTFSDRATMLFIVFALSHFSENANNRRYT